MASTPESKVKAQVKKYLEALGAWYCTPIGALWGRAGIPDFIVCWKGKFFGIEVKAPGKLKNTSPSQVREIQNITVAGGIAFVIDDVTQLARVFSE